MSDAPRNADNYCYRHPDRQSFVLCQRCGRTICPECQTQAAVGVHCPECVREARQSAPRTKPRIVSAMSSSSDKPVATYALMGASVLGYLVSFSGALVAALIYVPGSVLTNPWSLFTANFINGSIINLLFNLLAIFFIGRTLEQMLGRGRFLALFFLSGLGAAVASELLGSYVAGASPAIFGLLIAIFVIQRNMGSNNYGILIIVGLYLVYSVVVQSNAWVGYIGAIVVAGLASLMFVRTRRISQAQQQRLLLGGLAAVLVVIAVAHALV